MPLVGTSSSGQFSCVTGSQHTLKDLRTKRKGQPVFVLGHVLERKGKEASFEVFNDRIALVKFDDGAMLPMVLQGYAGDCLLKKALEVAPFVD